MLVKSYPKNKPPKKKLEIYAFVHRRDQHKKCKMAPPA